MSARNSAWGLLRWWLGQPRDSTQVALVSHLGTLGDPSIASWVIETEPGAVPGAGRSTVRRASPGSPVVVAIPFDLLGWVGDRLVLAGEDRLPKDRLGRPRFGHDALLANQQPVVDQVLAGVRATVLAAARELGHPFWYVHTWPAGAPFALFASHDMDKVHEREPANLAHNLAAILKPGADGMRPPTPRAAWRRLTRAALAPIPHDRRVSTLLEMENVADVRSTVFVHVDRRLHRYGARYAVHDRSVTRSLARFLGAGVELALHTGVSYRSTGRGVVAAVRTLEERSGAAITGARSHYLCLDRPDLWESLAGAGLRWDSTVGFTTGVGFRAGTCHPFRVPGFDLVEVPLAAMDVGLLGWTRSSGQLPEELLDDVVGAVVEHGGVLTLNWHTNMFGFPELRHVVELYERALQTARQQGAWSATGGELVAWYEARDGVSVNGTSHEVLLRRQDRLGHLEMGAAIAGETHGHAPATLHLPATGASLRLA